MDPVPYKVGLTRLPFWAAAFVALVCAAILGISGMREWNSRAATLQDAEVDLVNLARSLTQHAEDSIDLLDGSIIGLVFALENQGTGPDKISTLRKIISARKAGLERIDNVIISDENGRWIVSSGAAGPSLRDREFFRHHMQSAAREAYIGPPIRSRVSGEWIITVSRRYNHPDGSFAGVVLAASRASYFSEFYRRFEVNDNSSISLLNAAGTLMARNPDDGTYVGRDKSKEPLFSDPSLQSASGVYHYRSPVDGVLRMHAYQRSGRFPLVVRATAQQDEVLAGWRAAAITRMMFVLGLAILIAVMGFYLVRQLLQGQRMAAALAAKEANFRVLAEGSSDMVTRVGRDEQVYYASPSSVRLLGWDPEQLVGTSALAGVDPEDLPRVEQTVAALKRGEAEEARIAYRTRHRDKSEIWVESTLRVTRTVDGVFDGVVAITRDVTQQKNLEGKLETLATEDGLTGLSNRRRFDERLAEEWGRACRERTPLALLMIDLDHFKTFNDEYGHLAGDECLRAAARVLAAEAKRTTDLAARYGGEEFAMLLPNTDAAGCERIGERILNEIRQIGIVHRLNLPSGLVTASIGGAVVRPGAGRAADHASLIEAADRALYAAKDRGRDRLAMAPRPVPQLLHRSLAG